MDIGNQVLTSESSEIKRMIEILKRVSDLLDNESQAYRPILNGEHYLTERELSKFLKLTQRTLIEHRMNGKIPYYKLFGRILYKENDIIKLLEKNRIEAFR